MLTLMIQQTLANGVKKVWRLRPDTKVKTFGSSRLADVISIDPLAKGIQGAFEHRQENGEDRWYYVDLDRAHTLSDQNPETHIKDSTKLKLDGSLLELQIIDKDFKVFENPEAFIPESKGAHPYTMYIAKMNGAVIELEVRPRGEKYVSPLKGQPHIEIIEKNVDLKDVQDMMKLNKDDYFDNDSRKGAYILLASAFIIMTVGIFFTPEVKIAEVPVPSRATKIVVMTDTMKRNQNLPVTPPKVQPRTPPPAQKMQVTNVNPVGGNKVAGVLKSFSANRISQMLGKVSAQAAKTDKVVVSVNGSKASAEASTGRATASIAPMKGPGKDWSKAAQGGDGTISTAGRGGGQSTSTFGNLKGGNTGQAGVGLIEDESEVVGGLDRELIAQYIKTQLGQILYCYERQLSANPDLEGKVSVKFTISGTGKVEMQKIGDTTLKNATVEGCILNRVAQWKFPNPQGGTKVVVTYPFLFKSTN